MDYVNINPGLKTGLRQAFTIMMAGRVFFLTHNVFDGTIEWSMFMDDLALKEEVEEVLRNYLMDQD